MKHILKRKDNGITLMTLVITVVVLIILTFTITVNIDQLTKQKEFSGFQSDLTVLEEEINQYYVRTKSIPIINRYTNTSFLTGIKNVNDDDNYYVIDIRQLDVSLNLGKDYQTALSRDRNESISDLQDIYIINEQSHTVYYPKGAYYDGGIHYTLALNYTSVNTTTVTRISTAQELASFRTSVNEGNNYSGQLVVLDNDINLSTVCSSTLGSWEPIGTETNMFQGTFNGNGHKISNLYINSSTNQYTGLFGVIENATIKNLVMENVYVLNSYTDTNMPRVGGLIGIGTTSNISNCGIKSGSISHYNNTNAVSPSVGGIGGISITSSITNCFNSAQISGGTSINEKTRCGGIVGSDSNTIFANCYNTGNISSVGQYAMAGGIIGQGSNASDDSIKITSCYNIGNLTANGSTASFEGGIIAYNNWRNDDIAKPLVNCYCTTANTNLQTYYDGSGRVYVTSNRVEPLTLKTYASTLGKGYKEDTNNVNNGYPILTWQ